jgi:RNA recognition motif-containing protein
MRTQDRQQGHRSSRGGSRRGRGGRYSNSAPPQPVKKKTLWEKITSLFTGDKSKPAAGNGYRRAERDERSDRGNRFERSETPRTPHKPEVVEVSSPKLYVGNLSFDATESDLFDLFNGVGKVLNAEIVSHKYTQKSKGFAFVVMTSIDEAKRAVTELHDKEFMGRKLVVSGAKTNDVRSGGDSSASE